MDACKVIFWISIGILFYCYFGYAFVVIFLVKCKKLLYRKKSLPGIFYQPSVALIIPAYNEIDIISEKIRNTLELDYPPALLSIIFITDGSTDGTPNVIGRHSLFTLLHVPERKGKAAAMNRAMKMVTQQVVIFSDANSLLNSNCINEMVKHYVDPAVGGVAGEKKIYSPHTATPGGEGLYWQYESFLKKMDAELYSVVGAAGELLSVRSGLYEPITENTIIEDFVLSMRICLKGYVIRYEPNATALETSSVSMPEEQERKVRISAGAFQAMGMLKPLFNVFRYPLLSFQYISHRVLRWTLAPVCLLAAFVSNLLLVVFAGETLYNVLFSLQSAFYLLAVPGWFFAAKNKNTGILQLPYYFLFMNMAVFKGFFRIVTKRQSVLWKKANRQKVV